MIIKTSDLHCSLLQKVLPVCQARLSGYSITILYTLAMSNTFSIPNRGHIWHDSVHADAQVTKTAAFPKYNQTQGSLNLEAEGQLANQKQPVPQNCVTGAGSGDRDLLSPHVLHRGLPGCCGQVLHLPVCERALPADQRDHWLRLRHCDQDCHLRHHRVLHPVDGELAHLLVSRCLSCTAPQRMIIFG